MSSVWFPSDRRRHDVAAVLIGDSAAIRRLREEVERCAASSAKVLITGETGVGKELVASHIHAISGRGSRPFVAINCASVPDALLESELFGHVKGSFTGAHRDAVGKLASANGGTVFLDEVAEMSPRMQALLLRFLQHGEVQRLGADGAPRRVDVRVLSATTRSLPELVETGAFREDLYYRLNIVHIHVPPLRERLEDIPTLAEHFLTTWNDGAGRLLTLPPQTFGALQQHDWPGNVRQLESYLRRLTTVGDAASIDEPPRLRAVTDPPLPVERRRMVADDLFDALTKQGQSFWAAVYPPFMHRAITRQHLRDVLKKGLEQTCGNYRSTARLFNIPDSDYKKFMDFLRTHDCQLPFRDFR
jgi:transcriptional regulator with PAS, ATPase and Fis domain